MKNNNFNAMRSDYPPLPTLPRPASRADPSKSLVIAELLKEPGNDVCADCCAAISMDNAWAVLSYGILVCDDCKLVHIELQNHYKSPESNDSATDSSTSGILSTQIAHVWEEKDIVQIKNNGNKKTNGNLLKNSPVWQYRPSANDGIKLKEHWIKCKYSGNAGEAAENPAKMASKKQFIGFQFIRPTPKGETYHCCVVIQNDTLYLTSDKRNEEISVECIETVVVNSKRIGHENGVQLTYRVNNGKDGNSVAFTYLQHDTMETVMNWVNLVLYTKYTVLKRKYPTMIGENISKILNCGMVKESYMHVTGKGLIYLSLSEARLTCFQHHLDDVPLFQIAVSTVMNLTASQYLDAVACFFDIETSKILSYGDWLNALELVLKTDKIAAMPDDVPKPTFPFSLLKKPDAPATPVDKSEPAPVTEKPVPVSTAPPSNNAPLNNNPPPKSDADKDGDKKPGSYECYPPIGPMGEMGKVFRGELPPDAIKPPPSKTELSRVAIFGDYIPQLTAGHVPLPIKSASYGDLMNQNLTSFATTLNPAANQAMINQTLPKDTLGCYPPIGGPPQARKLRCDLSTLTNTQVAQLRKQEALEELRTGPASMAHNSLLLSQLAQKQNLFDQARIQNSLIAGGRFPEADPQLAAQAINPSAYPGWGDAAAESILTMPWKNTSNGYEPSRAFSSTNAQYQDMWNAAAKMQSLNGDRNLLASQQGKNLPFGTWNARSPSVDLSQQTQGLIRNQTWGSGMASAGMEQWPNKSPTSPIDTFMPLNSRDARGSISSGMFGASGSGGGGRGLVLNGKMGQRSEPPSNQQSMIIDNLLRQWKSAEQRLLGLIHNSYVPASDMSPAGLDKDSAEHAYTCVSELFELLWKQRYDLALSFLRGFREVFANSIHAEIRNLFIGVGELDTMKQIFLQQGKEKFLSGSSGGPVTWKQPTTPQPAQSPQLDSNWLSSSATSSILTRDSPTDFSPWGSVVTPSSSMTTDPWAMSTKSSTRSASMSSDPWNTGSSIFSTSSSVAGPTFNRAPSRPSQSHAPTFGEHSPSGSAFGSKTSSDSTSPRVVTPPTSFEPLSAAVYSLESTLKNILLSNNSNENN